MQLAKNKTSTLAAAALGGLLLTACTGVEATPDPDEGTVAPSRAAAPIDDPAHTHEEVTVECSDPEALAANKGHAPAGWPRDWDETGAMPDPECHPDFIQVDNWDYLDQFQGEGIETSTLTRSATATDAHVNEQLWEQFGVSRVPRSLSFVDSGALSIGESHGTKRIPSRVPTQSLGPA